MGFTCLEETLCHGNDANEQQCSGPQAHNLQSAEGVPTWTANIDSTGIVFPCLEPYATACEYRIEVLCSTSTD